MQTLTTQLRVTLPSKILSLLQARANKLGLTMSVYVKNLVISDIKEDVFPCFLPSQQTIAAYKEAKKLEASGKLNQLDDLDSLIRETDS